MFVHFVVDVISTTPDKAAAGMSASRGSSGGRLRLHARGNTHARVEHGTRTKGDRATNVDRQMSNKYGRRLNVATMVGERDHTAEPRRYGGH